MQRTHDILAIVGRPNVGKSTLFNRIAGRRIAIVHQEPGVTRDRVSARAKWGEKSFEIVDTGGIAFMDDEKSGDLMANATRHQAEVAIEMASAIIMVVDVTEGVVPLDLEIARKLRTSGKKILLAVNKVDNAGRARNDSEFATMGFKQTFSIAAVHGTGVEELLDAATEEFSKGMAEEAVRPPKIAIVGRPNVGKSSLLNAVLKDDVDPALVLKCAEDWCRFWKRKRTKFIPYLGKWLAGQGWEERPPRTGLDTYFEMVNEHAERSRSDDDEEEEQLRRDREPQWSYDN